MLVHFVTDEPTKIPAIRLVLEPRYHVVPRLLGSDDMLKGTSGVLMVDADLRKSVRVEQIKLVLRELSGDIVEKLFIVKNNVRSLIAQAYALGATAVVSRPREIIFELEQIEATRKSTQSEDAAIAPPEVTDSAMAFASMFSAVRRGRLINLLDAEQATAQIITSIEQNGLRAWLDDVRRYHEGTFQHCLLVTGVAVSFALELGFAGSDVARLGIAATLHDIGKARIPLTILDKPGRLDPREEEKMRLHPVIGHDLLKDVPGISPEKSRWRTPPPRISRRLRLSRRPESPGDIRPGQVADDLGHLRGADRGEALPAADVASGRLQDSAQHGWKAGDLAGQGVP